MTPFEKHAWFNLGVLILALGLIGPTVVLVEGNWYVMPFCLLGLWTLGPIFYNKESLIDERAQAIQRQATRIAIWCYWLLFILAGFIAWLLCRSLETIPPFVIPLLVFGGFGLFVLIHAGSTIVLHRLENWYAGH